MSFVPNSLFLAGAVIVSLAGPAARTVAPPQAPVAAAGVQLRRGAIGGPMPALVTRIIDGDTFEARVRVWFRLEITTLVRIRGFDAPEIKARCAAEAAKAALATEALRDYLSMGAVTLSDVALDKYGGRVLANVAVADALAPTALSEDIAVLMLASGLARPYAGGRRQSWCGLAEAR